MQFYSMYAPESEADCMQFVRQQNFCMLQTSGEDGAWQNGVFNHVMRDGFLYLHLHRADAQVADLRGSSHCKLVFFDYSGFVPSYAKSPTDASFATMFYRFAELSCHGEEVAAEADKAAVLDALMERFQPEGGYLKLADHQEEYRKTLAAIVVWRFAIAGVRSKWKLGQNRSPEERLRAFSLIRR
jgi:uncharacterized protein